MDGRRARLEKEVKKDSRDRLEGDVLTGESVAFRIFGNRILFGKLESGGISLKEKREGIF